MDLNNLNWKHIKKFADDLDSPSVMNYAENWDNYYIWITYQDITLACDVLKDSADATEFETYYKPYVKKKISSDDGVSKSTAQLYYKDASDIITPVTSNQPLPVAGAGGVNNIMLVVNAVNTTNYSLSGSAYSETTNISNDYILDSIDLRFSTAEAKTITIATTGGTILWGGSQDTSTTNLGYNATAKNFNLVFDQAFDANQNITVSVTPTSGACLLDCIVKIKREQSTILEVPAVKLVNAAGAAWGVDHVQNKIRTSTVDFRIDIAHGYFSGAAEFRGFGEREAIAVQTNGVDIWRGPTDIVPIPNGIVGEQMAIVSTSTQDVSGGTGVSQILLHYLDAAGMPQDLLVNLNGTNTVYTTVSNITFVNELHTTAVGTNGVAVGDIRVHKIEDTNTVYNLIKAGGNMSLSCIRKIPANKKYYISNFTASAAGNKPSAIRLRSTDHHGVLYDGVLPVYIFKDSMFLGEATASRDYNPPIVISGGTIIKVSVWATQAGSNIAASFNGWYENA